MEFFSQAERTVLHEKYASMLIFIALIKYDGVSRISSKRLHNVYFKFIVLLLLFSVISKLLFVF